MIAAADVQLWRAFGKRVFDLTLCIAVLPLALLVMAVVAIAVRLDSPGPVLFCQRRTGHHGSIFKMYKFRTMVRDAEQLKASLQHLNVLPFPDFKIPDDPRITPVGRFLRKTSLDEVPQIFNILRGDMSWVGPRPTSFAPTTYDIWHGCRLELRPGLTGLWQVRMRSSSSFDERVRLDVQYLRTASLRTDVSILLQTMFAVFRRTGL